MDIAYPFHFDRQGRTAETDDTGHIRDLIEQVLFTAPGERVNRPTFGSGLRQLVFAPNNGMLVIATQVAVQGALQQWLGDVIQLDDVHVEGDDATFRVTVQYTIRRTQQQQTTDFVRGVAP